MTISSFYAKHPELMDLPLYLIDPQGKRQHYYGFNKMSINPEAKNRVYSNVVGFTDLDQKTKYLVFYVMSK